MGASLSGAAGAHHRWICTWRWDGHLCAPGGPIVARETRSAFCHRESGGSFQQYRHGGSHTCPGRRLHASWYRFRRGNQCCPVRQPQLQLHPRYGLSWREPRPPCRGGAPIPSRQNHSGVHHLCQSEPRQDRAGVVGHRWYQPYGWRTLLDDDKRLIPRHPTAQGGVACSATSAMRRDDGALGGCAQLTGAPPPPAIGTIQTATGLVTVMDASGVVAQVKVGDPVYRHDTLETGADGAVGITFIDGTAFNLSNNARMALNE